MRTILILLLALVTMAAGAALVLPPMQAEDAAPEGGEAPPTDVPETDDGEAPAPPADAEIPDSVEDDKAGTVVTRDIVGIVRENMSVSVGTVGSGQIAEINREKGDEVEKGAVLARLRYDKVEIEIERAKISVTLSEARAELAAHELKFYAREHEDALKLKEEGAATASEVLEAEQEMIRAKISLTVAKGELKMAKALLRYREVVLEDTKILSPIKGVVTEKFIEVGEVYDSGDRIPMFEIIDIDVVKVFVYVPLELVPKVRPGDKVKVKVELPGKTLYDGEGQVVYLHPTIDAGSETMLTKIEVPNGDHEIKVGLRATVTFSWPENEKPNEE